MPVYDVESLDESFKGRKNSHAQYKFQPSPLNVPQPPAPEEEKRRWIPFLIPTILIANILVFVLTMYYNNCPAHISTSEPKCVLPWLHRFSFQSFRENPMLGPSALTLQKMGGLERSLVLTHHQAWRLVSCIWLHAGVFHLLVNMIALLIIGIRLEMDFGAPRIGLIYLLSGFGGSLLSALFVENQISVGASGALFGLLGATLSELLTNWSRYENKCAPLVTLILLVLVNLAFGVMPHVDNFAHIGGFVAGFLLGFVVLIRVQYGYINKADLPYGVDTEVPIKRKYKAYQIVCLVVSLILLLGLYIAACVVLFTGIDANKKCSWCHYLSCVPTSQWQCNNLPS
jgi:membrane associated rhomboid family serine protease